MNQAKQLYLSGLPPHQIAAHLQIPLSDLALQIYDPGPNNSPSWHEEYLQLQQEGGLNLLQYRALKPNIITAAEASLVQVVARSAHRLQQDPDRILDLNEMERATNVITQLDKLTRLENNTPTDISQTTTITYSLRDLARLRDQADAKRPATIVQSEPITPTPAPSAARVSPVSSAHAPQ